MHGALVASPTGINHAADTGVIAHLEVFYIGAYSNNDASNFVARSQGVFLRAPFISNRVNV